MKPMIPLRRPFQLLRIHLYLACVAVVPFARGEPPVITSVQLEGTDVVVVATVSTEVKRVTLEARSRLRGGGWTPRSVARPEANNPRVTFRIPRSTDLEVLRVRADDREVLPAGFYSGTNSFPGQPANPNRYFLGAPTDDAGGALEPEPSGRAIVESDIWKIRGDTLYFFNQYRGLQVIDIAQPDQARVTGVLSLPAAGEQMYLLEDGHVVLLAQDGCGWSADGVGSRVLVIGIAGGAPSIAATLPLSGYVLESRLVGTALYVASQSYRQVVGSGGTTWEWGTIVSAFDLSSPVSPVARGVLWFPGYGSVVSATDRFLFVSTQDPSNWRQSLVNTIDISDPAGAMRIVNAVRPAGLVKDKFKLNLSGDTFTVITEIATPNLLTRLETFSFADPSTPRKLGELSLGPSERLHATRFADDRVYVVTFFVQFQMDPLWVVDLKDPTRPSVTGQLEIPGWSTYLHPLGNHLVAAGIETNRTTVSLFDVANPARPALLSRVVLGSGWSWSEANMDEKAFNVLPDERMILLPIQSWTNGHSSTQVQIVDLLSDSLVARGAIDHDFGPRRATVHRDRVISISGTEFLSVDATDRDHPLVKSKLPLAWSVDRLFVQGEFLIELTGAPEWSWGVGATDAAIRVARGAKPDDVLEQVELLEKLPILASAVEGGRLFVVQAEQGTGTYLAEDTNSPAAGASPIRLSIFDVTRLPELPLLGSVKADVAPLGWGSTWKAVWPRAGLMVVAGGGGSRWYPWLDVAFGGPGGFIPWWGWGGGGGRLIAFDVQDPVSPGLLSDVTVAENQGQNFSLAHPVNGLVYLSHQELCRPEPVVTCDATTGDCVTNAPPEWVWFWRTFLDVVDYVNPAEPVIRAPVSIPGALEGVSHQGELLYTLGTRWRSNTNWWYDGSEFLEASAFDGVQAHLVDSLELSTVWPRPALVRNDSIFLGRALGTGDSTNRLETWELNAAGQFARIGQMELPSPAHALAAFDDLLAVQSYDQVRLFNVENPREPDFLAGGGEGGCFWFNLDNADGAVDRGLYLPLGLFGVMSIDVPVGR